MKCGNKCADDSNFCLACGNPLTKPTPQPAELQQAPQLMTQPAAQPVPQPAPQPPMRQPAPQPARQPAPVKKSADNSFVSKLKSDKLTMGLFCTSVVLALAVIAMAVIMITSGSEGAAKTADDAAKTNGLVGVWGYSTDYEEIEDEAMYFVFRADGKGERIYFDNGGTDSESISWKTQGKELTITTYYDTSGSDYDDSYTDEFEYEIDGNILYIISPDDYYAKLPLCFISADTSISKYEMADKFVEQKDEYFEVYEECMEEMEELYDTYD